MNTEEHDVSGVSITPPPPIGTMRPVVSALCAAMAAALAEAAEWVAGHPDRPRIERLARKFCENDRQDPDQVSMGRVIGNRVEIPPIGAKGTICLLLPLRPQWMLYIQEALTAIEFTEATK